jgi:hypothetical protein
MGVEEPGSDGMKTPPQQGLARLAWRMSHGIFTGPCRNKIKQHLKIKTFGFLPTCFAIQTPKIRPWISGSIAQPLHAVFSVIDLDDELEAHATIALNGLGVCFLALT